jgi:hypothetical protein
MTTEEREKLKAAAESVVNSKPIPAVEDAFDVQIFSVSRN